jgi:SDR family mycofactocin-dependent oxidoreductase
MSGELDGRVALVTGAARGQGRSHARTLATAGADIVAVDICRQLDTVPYPLATEDDLAETAELVRGTGRRCLTHVADVREREGLAAAVAEAMNAFGRIDVTVANAGVAMGMPERESATEETIWADYIAVNLTGAYNTIQVTKPAMLSGGRGGSIIVISSTSGLKGQSRGDTRSDAYTAAKHGLVGVMRAAANELGPHGIRVNAVHPTAVSTPMVDNDAMRRWIAANVDSVAGGFGDAMHVGRIEARDVSEAVLWLASDSSRYVTGVSLPVDAGFIIA